MSTGGSPPPRFRVDASADVLAEFQRCQADANGDGFGSEFFAAILTIHQRLLTEADTLGEQLFDLPNARLQIRQVVLRPAVVEYGVHYRNPVVFIRAYRVLSPQ